MASAGRSVGEGSGNFAKASKPTPCKFGSRCTREDCWFSHEDRCEAAPQAPSVGSRSGIPCKFGSGCTRGDCKFSHEDRCESAPPSVASKPKCRFGSSCRNLKAGTCSFDHTGDSVVERAQTGSLKRCVFGFNCYKQLKCRFHHTDEEKESFADDEFAEDVQFGKEMDTLEKTAISVEVFFDQKTKEPYILVGEEMVPWYPNIEDDIDVEVCVEEIFTD